VIVSPRALGDSFAIAALKDGEFRAVYDSLVTHFLSPPDREQIVPIELR
jgi:hypothetical protein